MFADMFMNNSRLLSVEEAREWRFEPYCAHRVAKSRHGAAVMRTALVIPDRLGAWGTARDKANDRRFLRQLRHWHENSIRTWVSLAGDLPQELSPEEDTVRIDAAQIIVLPYIRDLTESLREDRGMVVTHAIQSGLREWANRAAHAFTREIDQLSRIKDSGVKH